MGWNERSVRACGWSTARGGSLGAAVVLAGCLGGEVSPLEPLDTETTSGVDVDSTGSTTSPGSFSGSGQLPGEGDSSSTTTPADTDGCVCPPGQQCIGGLCFDCRPSACDGECGPGESCQCPPDDPCCDMGTCVPDACPLPPVEGNYADCLDEDGTADEAACDGAPCIADAFEAPTAGVCVPSGCELECQCPLAPPTGDAPVTCEDVTGDGLSDCWLDCASGQTCPEAMICFGGFICLFPVEDPPPPPPPAAPAPYGDCADNPVSTCQPGEDACLGDVAGTAAACSQSGCAVAADCPAAPPSGNAPVACADLGGGNACYLDCAGGQICPDGTVCTAVGGGFACLWPDDGLLLDESFELGVLRPGWTVIDVDGLMPANPVSFVTDAFVVTDELEPGMNLGAYSTSWYDPPAQADDWLVTPQLVLGPASVLSWEAWAPDPSYPDGYEVRISTGLPVVADFLANQPVLVIAEEADSFTPHMVDLAASGYANQAVYVAFRNHSNDDFILVVDDVRVTE